MYKIITIVLSLLCTITASANTPIDSPNGFYSVSKKGVDEIQVVGDIDGDKDGDYEVRFRNVESIYSAFSRNEITAAGWWYPARQQFNAKLYEKPVNLLHCSKWGELDWSFTFVPVKIKLGGGEVYAYAQSEKHTSSKTTPKPYCINKGIKKITCEVVRCNEWKQPEPNNYLVKSRKDALSLFRILSNQ